MSGNPQQAWYSEAHAEKHGTAIWQSVDGEELEVTFVGRGEIFLWKDKVFLGYVTRYLRQGRTGNRPPALSYFKGFWL